MTELLIDVDRDHPDDYRDPYLIDDVRRQARERIARLVPARYRDAIPDLPEVIDWARALVRIATTKRLTLPAVASGPSLLLLGPTGSGKTHQAYGAIRILALSGVSCRWEFATAADIYARLRPRHRVDSEAEYEHYADTAVLVIDDLGAAKNSEWTEEINYRLINHRYERELPTLITSNVPPKELSGALGDRVSSRLVEMAHRIVIPGPDRRRAPRLTA
jgi:DNA replication protein DnaC